MGAATALVMVVAACADPAPLKLFAAPSWTDVPQHGLTSHLTSGVALDAARGEREGAWVVLQPHGAWTELSVEVTELSGPAGRLPPQQLRLQRAYFERTGDGRFLADVLVPLERSSLRDPRHPESSNLPLWFEVEVPRGAKPGRYQGFVRVRIGCEAAELPVTLQVHRVKLAAEAVRVLVTTDAAPAPALTASAKAAGVDLLGGGQGGGGVQAWEIPVGDRDAIGLGLGAPPTSGSAVAWLTERDGAALLLYEAGAAGLNRSARPPEALWYRAPGSREGLMETVRLARLRDALELRALIAASRQRGFNHEVDRWSERLTPPGGHLTADPDAYAAARRALLQRHDR